MTSFLMILVETVSAKEMLLKDLVRDIENSIDELNEDIEIYTVNKNMAYTIKIFDTKAQEIYKKSTQ